jgi:hypothetical protein
MLVVFIVMLFVFVVMLVVGLVLKIYLDYLLSFKRPEKILKVKGVLTDVGVITPLVG